MKMKINQSKTLSLDAFKLAFRNHAAGVAVITADIGEGPVGLTATSVISVSADPPLVAFSLSAVSSSTPTLVRAETLVVHLLSANQLEIARLCSTSGINRFEDTTLWSRMETGEPYFPSAHAWLRCEVVQQMSAGGSVIILAEVLDAKSPKLDAQDGQEASEQPLVYHDRTWHVLGEHSRI